MRFLFWRKEKEPLHDLVRDLTRLQISTIVKSHISGLPMPHEKTALQQLSDDYALKLNELSSNSDVSSGFGTLPEQFRSYQERSRKLILEIREIDKLNYGLLLRIESGSQEILGILEGNPGLNQQNADYRLLPSEYSSINRLWLLGTEPVAMQSIIQLDGDLTTRLQPAYASIEYSALHKLHSVGVEMSVQYWRSILEIVSSLAGSIISMSRRRRV